MKITNESNAFNNALNGVSMMKSRINTKIFIDENVCVSHFPRVTIGSVTRSIANDASFSSCTRTTQRFAVEAVLATGNSVAGSERTYVREQEVVAALVNFVGDPILRNAYFNGASTLVSAYEAFHGSRSFAILKRILDGASSDATAFDRALRLLRPPSIEQRVGAIEALSEEGLDGTTRELLSQMVSGWSVADRIAVINSFLDWWVSDNDLDLIEVIVNSNSGDRPAIASALQPRIRSLTSIGQRTRLRLILGVV